MKRLVVVLALTLLGSAVWAQNQPVNLAAAANGARIVEVSSEDANAEWGAASLIDGIKGHKGWSSQLQVGPPPQSVTIDLAGDQPVLIDRVVINLETGAELLYGPYWAKDVTILASATDMTDLSFQPIATATLAKTTQDQTITFNPVAAKFVKLRVESTQGGAQGNHVEVGELEVYAAGTEGVAAAATGPIGPTAVGPQGPAGAAVVTPVQPTTEPGPLVTPGPGLTQPDPMQPGVTQPGVTQPGVTQPVVAPVGDPGPVAPVGVQPAGPGAVPVVPQVGVTQPAVTQPGAMQPDPTQPAVTQPGIAQPGVTQPGVTQPIVTQPIVTQPAITQPGVTEPGMTQPAVTDPGIMQPGVGAVPVAPVTAGQDTTGVDAAITEVVTSVAPTTAPAYAGPEVNLAAQTAGGTVQASSYLNDAFGPARLNDGMKGGQDLGDEFAWCSAADPVYPQDLIVEFKDREVHVVSKVVLNANTGQVDLFGERWPKDVEIHYSTSGTEDGDFHKVAEASLKKIQEDQVVEFDPVAAKFIKVRVLSNHGHRKYVELAEVEVWGARDPGIPSGPAMPTPPVVQPTVAVAQPVGPSVIEPTPITGPVAVTPTAPTTVDPTAVQVPQPGEEVDLDTLIRQLEDVLQQLKTLRNEGG